MFYLIFEDRSSCKDLVVRLLENHVPSFDQVCKYYSACGAPQAGDIFENFISYGEADVWTDRLADPNDIEHIILHEGDTLIFIVDATARISKSQIVNPVHIRNVRIFRTIYYCFESCLYSYQGFKYDIFGKQSDFNAFADMRNAICGGKFPTLHDAIQYKQMYGKSSKQKTLESIATSIFASYMQALPCVKLNKNKYIPLTQCLGTDNLRFYNNNCDLSCDYCKDKHNLAATSKFNSCSLKPVQDTLYDFYLNSDWSLPLECLCEDIDRELLDIFHTEVHSSATGQSSIHNKAYKTNLFN